MQDDGLIGCRVFVLYIAFFFLTGTITYNIVEPHSFFGILIFLVVWGVEQVISQFLLMLLISTIIAIFSRYIGSRPSTLTYNHSPSTFGINISKSVSPISIPI